MNISLIKKLFFLVLLTSVLFPFNACKKLDLEREVAITTDSIVILGSYVEFTCTVIDFGGYSRFDQYGICWSATGVPTVSDCHTEEGPMEVTGSHTFVLGTGGLSANTEYQVRPYVKAGNEIFYGKAQTFWNLYASDSWQDYSWVMNGMFTNRRCGVGFSMWGKSYIGLGIDEGNTLHRDLWAFNPSDNTFTQAADFPGMALVNASSFTWNDDCYVGFGDNNAGAFSDSIWKYNVGANQWIPKISTGYAATSVCLFVICDYVYFGLGMDGSGVKNNFFRLYLPSGSSPESRNDFPFPGRLSAVSFAAAGTGYFGLGLADDMTTSLKSFYKYNPDTDVWSVMDSLPGNSRFGAFSFIVNEGAYIGGGADSFNGFFTDFYYLDTYSQVWYPLGNLPITPRYNAITFSNGPMGYVVGGKSETSTLNDMWRYIP